MTTSDLLHPGCTAALSPRIDRLGPAEWAAMSLAQRRALATAYRDDQALLPGTPAESLTAYVDWFDEVIPTGHVVYYVLSIDGQVASVARTHDDQFTESRVNGALLVEALQTVRAFQRRGLAKELIRSIVTSTAPTGLPVVASVSIRNTASRATFRACGFTPEPGRDDDSNLWWFRR